MNGFNVFDGIDIHWAGIRKSCADTAFCGYFTEKGKRNNVLYSFEINNGVEYPRCYLFRGKNGKKIIIEEADLTQEFLNEIKILSKNFKPTTVENLIAKIGSQNIKELELFLMYLKLKND